MPLYYNDVPGALQTTNATPNTANDSFFLAVGATRNLWLEAIWPAGYGAGLTSISGIVYRVEKWTSTASSGGTAVTPSPVDSGYAASKHTCGYATATVTPGTGGPTLMLSIGSGTTSPGNWQARDLDRAPLLLAAATQSLDIFNVSGTASLNYQISTSTVE